MFMNPERKEALASGSANAGKLAVHRERYIHIER